MAAFKNIPVIIFFTIFLFIIATAYLFNSLNPPQLLPQRIDEIDQPSAHFIIKDQQGVILMQTGLQVSVNDEFINEDDLHYQVINVTGNQATAVLKEKSDNLKEALNPMALPAVITGIADIFSLPEKTKNVVIYHTHTAESYIPTSNTASRKKGGDILQVGEAFKQSLIKANIDVVHNTDNHSPHDINAYHRSRKTLVQLLKSGPDAAFDLHRDSTPASTYATRINGIDTCKIMIVVGRSNLNMQRNLEYAKRIKAVGDQAHPGLMRGIFIGKGDYNQDLYPSALLFEIGSQHNTLAMAEIGARCLADTIAIAFARTE